MQHVTEEVKLSQALLAGSLALRQEDRVLLEDNLDCLKERLGALGCALGQRCDYMRTRAQELNSYQVGEVLCTHILKSYIHHHGFCCVYYRLNCSFSKLL